MAKKSAEQNGEVAGFRIFDKPGKSGNRMAVDLSGGTVIETDGPGKFFIYTNGIQHAITSTNTLEQICGIE